jgi:hypothetical protein
MTFTILFLILCVVLIGTAAANVSGVDYDPPDIGNLIPPKTVDSVDVTALMGRWYLMYTSTDPRRNLLARGSVPYSRLLRPRQRAGKAYLQGRQLDEVCASAVI